MARCIEKAKKSRAELVFVTHSHKVKKEIKGMISQLGAGYSCVRMDPYPEVREERLRS